MYYRSQGYRYPRDMRIPSNYGGNAFSSKENDTPAEVSEELTAITEEEVKEVPESISQNELDKENKKSDESKPTSLFQSLGASSLFGNIGSEELLILAVIMLLSDSDGGNDIIWLLLLLLFIK